MTAWRWRWIRARHRGSISSGGPSTGSRARGGGEPRAWYLRDLSVAAGPVEEDAAVVVVTAGAEIEGFTPVGETWRLGDGWDPLRVRLLPLWRRVVHREPHGKPDGGDGRILRPGRGGGT